MATTTTNFGWDIPQSTDLVKDGATAIAALGQDIDTAFVDFKGGTTGQVLKKTSNTDLDVEWGTASSGLTLINTTSFSAVASQTVSNIFTSAYRNYFLTWESTSPLILYPNWRLATSGTPNSTTDYQIQRYESSGTGNSSQRTSASTVFSLTSNSTTAFASTIYLFAPQVAEKTFVISHTIQNYEGTFTSPVSMFSTGIFNATTQFDGIQLLPNTSTITGTLKVYGLN
jgi:hypothetical protein